MKYVSAGAFAGSLFLFPQLGLAEQPIGWRGDQPVWKAASPDDWASAPAAIEWSKTTNPNWSVSPIVDSGFQSSKSISDRPTVTSSLDTTGERDANGRVNTERIGTFLPESASPPEQTRQVQFSDSQKVGRGAPLTSPYAGRPYPVPPYLEKIGIAPRETANAAPDTTGAPAVSQPATEQTPVAQTQPPAAQILPPAKDPPSPQATLGRPVKAGHRFLGGLFDHKPDASSAGDSTGAADGFISAVNPSGPVLSVQSEYLMWWARNDRTPVLATTGTEQGVGVIGQPGTRSLYGPGPIDLTNRSGGRFRASLLLNESDGYGIDGSYLFLGQRQSSFSVSDSTTPIISRPVFVLNNNQENVETVAFPNFSTGVLSINNTSQFWGADANIFKRLCTTCDRTLDIFVGYRYLNLTESLTIVESITAGANAPDPVGTHATVTDRFATRNVFNGGQLGTRYEQRWGRWFVNLRASVALGQNQETINIQGSQVRVRPGEQPAVFVGGLLAAQSNIGRFSTGRFSVAPDVALNLGYQFTPNLRAYVGYSFLYWTNVARPGQQIDRSVDLTFIPNSPAVQPTGQRRPAVLEQQSDFWAQGVNFGVELLW